MRDLLHNTHLVPENDLIMGTGISSFGSLISRSAAIGNRAATSVAATTIVRVTRAGRPGLDELFPLYDFADIDYADVEVVLHVIAPPSRQIERTEFDLSANASRLVTTGWFYCALPWSETVRRNLIFDFMLYSKFEDIPANRERPSKERTLLPGEAFVILAFDTRNVVGDEGRVLGESSGVSDRPTRPARPSTIEASKAGEEPGLTINSVADAATIRTLEEFAKRWGEVPAHARRREQK